MLFAEQPHRPEAQTPYNRTPYDLPKSIAVKSHCGSKDCNLCSHVFFVQTWTKLPQVFKEEVWIRALVAGRITARERAYLAQQPMGR